MVLAVIRLVGQTESALAHVHDVHVGVVEVAEDVEPEQVGATVRAHRAERLGQLLF